MILYLIIVGLVLCFGLVVFVGAPYLPTLSQPKKDALDLLGLKEGDVLLELGSGDGRVLLEAAKRGIDSVGIEINPILVAVSWIVTFRHRRKVKIIWGNFWHKKWPPADGIFVFLLDKYMARLDKKIEEDCEKPVSLASFTFKIPDKKPAARKNGVFLYRY